MDDEPPGYRPDYPAMARRASPTRTRFSPTPMLDPRIHPVNRGSVHRQTEPETAPVTGAQIVVDPSTLSNCSFSWRVSTVRRPSDCVWDATCSNRKSGDSIGGPSPENTTT